MRAPQIYDLFFEKPAAVVDRYLRLELSERVMATGEVLAPVDESELEKIIQKLRDENVQSVAVCLLHSYAFPGHERQVGDYLHRTLPDIPVSLSFEVLPERREYERTATAAVNAYVRPVMSRYLDALQRGLSSQGIDGPLLIMQSAGGLTPAINATERPVYALESGPAAGVLAAGFVARKLGYGNVISFDMGGTTAKAAMVEEGRIPYSAEYEVCSAVSVGNRLTGGGGELIRAPSIDIAEVGAGGGSIAYLDGAGGLRVGPRSAGAVPGPVCYQKGGQQPTVTDANVVLGYIQSGQLAGGDVVISADAARRSIEETIARPLGLSTGEAAQGIHRIANAHMMRALREVSTQRGRDPREFLLMAFGGSGPIHAAGLARELGIRKVVVPTRPGLFSAVGMLVSGVEHHDVRSCYLSGERLTTSAINQFVVEMRDAMLQQFQSESYGADQVSFVCSVEMRYLGQASEIRVAPECEVLDDKELARIRTSFEDEHERLYGHRSEPGTSVEIVAIRLVGRAGGGDACSIGMGRDHQPSASSRTAMFGDPWGAVETPVVSRLSLTDRTDGPLLIDEYDATIVIPPEMTAQVDRHDNLVMEFHNASN